MDGLGLGYCVLLDLTPRDWGRTEETAQDALTASKLGDTIKTWEGCNLVLSLKSLSHPHKNVWAAHGKVLLHDSSSKVQKEKEIPDEKSINFS